MTADGTAADGVMFGWQLPWQSPWQMQSELRATIDLLAEQLDGP
jgi:hypothetical protein